MSFFLSQFQYFFPLPHSTQQPSWQHLRPSLPITTNTLLFGNYLCLQLTNHYIVNSTSHWPSSSLYCPSPLLTSSPPCLLRSDSLSLKSLPSNLHQLLFLSYFSGKISTLVKLNSGLVYIRNATGEHFWIKFHSMLTSLTLIYNLKAQSFSITWQPIYFSVNQSSTLLCLFSPSSFSTNIQYLLPLRIQIW